MSQQENSADFRFPSLTGAPSLSSAERAVLTSSINSTATIDLGEGEDYEIINVADVVNDCVISMSDSAPSSPGSLLGYLSHDEEDSRETRSKRGDAPLLRDFCSDDSCSNGSSFDSQDSISTKTSRRSRTSSADDSCALGDESSDGGNFVRKAGVAVVGGALVGVGLVMIPLPTPFGVVVAGTGMQVLGSEFESVAKVNEEIKEKAMQQYEAVFKDGDADVKPKSEQMLNKAKESFQVAAQKGKEYYDTAHDSEVAQRAREKIKAARESISHTIHAAAAAAAAANRSGNGIVWSIFQEIKGRRELLQDQQRAMQSATNRLEAIPETTVAATGS